MWEKFGAEKVSYIGSLLAPFLKLSGPALVSLGGPDTKPVLRVSVIAR